MEKKTSHHTGIFFKWLYDPYLQQTLCHVIVGESTSITEITSDDYIAFG